MDSGFWVTGVLGLGALAAIVAAGVLVARAIVWLVWRDEER